MRIRSRADDDIQRFKVAVVARVVMVILVFFFDKNRYCKSTLAGMPPEPIPPACSLKPRGTVLRGASSYRLNSNNHRDLAEGLFGVN